MSDNEIFRDVFDALDTLLQTRELEEGRELPPDSPTLADRRRQLDHAFWKAARAVVMSAIPPNHQGALKFPPLAGT